MFDEVVNPALNHELFFNHAQTGDFGDFKDWGTY